MEDRVVANYPLRSYYGPMCCRLLFELSWCTFLYRNIRVNRIGISVGHSLLVYVIRSLPVRPDMCYFVLFLLALLYTSIFCVSTTPHPHPVSV